MFDLWLEDAFWLVVILSGVPLAAASLAGLVVAVLQSATQIQEQSITYAVKFVAATAALAMLSLIHI